jgi:hypothetical protein
MALTFGSCGSGLGSRDRRAPTSSRRARVGGESRADDVALKALGQVLAEPRGFPARNGGLPSSPARHASRSATRRYDPRRGVVQAAGGAFEAIVVAAALAAGAAFVIAPIALAGEDLLAARAATPTAAHVREASAPRRPVVEARILKLAPAARD